MKKRYIIGIHFAVFVALSLLCLFTSEWLLNRLMPGFSDVSRWILLLSVETVAAFIAISISCIIFIKKQQKFIKKQQKT